jgi:hypothetical protein
MSRYMKVASLKVQRLEPHFQVFNVGQLRRSRAKQKAQEYLRLSELSLIEIN